MPWATVGLKGRGQMGEIGERKRLTLIRDEVWSVFYSYGVLVAFSEVVDIE